MTMRLLLSVLTLGALLPAAAGAATSTWTADPNHSSAGFTALHLGVSRVNGSIPIRSVTLEIPDGSDIPVALKAELDPAGVDTHNAMRDGDLRSEHFFEVATHPKMTFESTKIVRTDDKHFLIDGNLTMHGQTHPVELKAVFLAKGAGMRGETHLAYEATTTIDRSKWGMAYGTFLAANAVEVTLDIEAVKH